jgi:uncharacterized membrane protein YfcA
MDPAIVFFGFGVGFLVGLTGMGGGSLMTPLLILVFGVKPVTAIGTDIFYAAVTKTAGGWRHLKHKTVNMKLSWWMAAGSVPSAIAGVWVLDILKERLGGDLDSTVFAILAACLMVVGAITLLRSLFLADKIAERDDFEMHTRHKVAAVGIGATTGFIIGLSSAGSGTVIAIMLIAVFRLTPKRVVGTDVFHAAVLLWAASLAHIVSGNVDFALAANIILGSVPGVIIGSNLIVKWNQTVLRIALGVVLLAAGFALLSKADTHLVPYALGVATLSFLTLFGIQYALRREVEADPDEQEWLRQAAASVAVTGDEIPRSDGVEAEIARRSEQRQAPELASKD